MCQACAKPILLYGIELWSHLVRKLAMYREFLASKIENFQLKKKKKKKKKVPTIYVLVQKQEKVGFKGVYISRTCYPDGSLI